MRVSPLLGRRARRARALTAPRRRRAEQRDVLAEVQRDAPVPAPERAGPDPDELAVRTELVHPGG